MDRLAAAVLGFSASAAGIWWYAQDERERSLMQSNNQAGIQHEQVEIRKELALQTADLEEIRGRQAEIMHRFDRVEDGQRWLSQQMQEGTIALAIELGRVLERTEKNE